MYFIITKRTHFLAIFMSCILVILQFNTIISINGDILSLVGDYKVLKYYGILILVVLLSTMVHELIHGLVYRSFGGQFEIGFKGGCAYTRETTGIKLTVSQFAVVLLAPITLISTLSLFVPIVGGLIFFVNLLGSIGDLIMALWLTKVNKNSLIGDSDGGFVVEINDRKIMN